jgi:hypothetical protein
MNWILKYGEWIDESTDTLMDNGIELEDKHNALGSKLTEKVKRELGDKYVVTFSPSTTARSYADKDETTILYTCIVCGYGELDEPQYYKNGVPNDSSICSYCGWHSGYDDLDQGYTFEEYRMKWIREGARWFNRKMKPKYWGLEKQLERINVKLDK